MSLNVHGESECILMYLESRYKSLAQMWRFNTLLILDENREWVSLAGSIWHGVGVGLRVDSRCK